MSRSLGTAEVAWALGVSVSTVKRWIDEGILPAQRSGGGHRRLRGEDVVRAVRHHRLPSADLTGLLGAASASATTLPRRELLRALKDGDQPRVRQLLSEVWWSGMTMARLADDLVAPVMHAIGHQCASGALDTSEEHRATQLCVGAVYEIKARILERSTIDGAPVAIGGAPEDDPYLLTSLLAEMVLLEGGWNVMNLGPDVPMTALATAVRRWRPALVWLSASHLHDSRRFVREFTAFSEAVHRQNPAIVLGGRALTAELQNALRGGTFGTKMSHLSQLSRTLLQRDRGALAAQRSDRARRPGGLAGRRRRSTA